MDIQVNNMDWFVLPTPGARYSACRGSPCTPGSYGAVGKRGRGNACPGVLTKVDYLEQTSNLNMQAQLSRKHDTMPDVHNKHAALLLTVSLGRDDPLIGRALLALPSRIHIQYRRQDLQNAYNLVMV
jgi:hypothetical protein